jgi:outer membrane PBP1 activator LpoA protein
LNAIEGYSADPLYFFGMAVEDEARLAAQLAKRQGLRRAIAITTHTQLSQRLQVAFEEEWHSLGGLILQEIEYKNDPAIFADIAGMPDTAVFLATDAENARLIRPYLPNNTPIFATSQIFVGNNDSLTNYDLNGIRFVDMPWLLAPDHPAVMVYPRPAASLSADHERLYALGIDAFRLIQLLLAGKVESALPLDGVSGQVDLYGHTFVRIAVPAIFSRGQAQTRPVAPLPNERAIKP